MDALAQLALNRPVRVRVDSSYEVAPRLEQEVCMWVVSGSGTRNRRAREMGRTGGWPEANV